MKLGHWRLLVGLGLIAAVAAFTSVMAARSSADTTNPPPDWLETKVSQIVGPYSVSTPRAATWVLTTVGAYHDVMPDQGPAQASVAEKAVYVVFVDGSFTPTHTPEVWTGPVGTQLVLEFDANTHVLAVLGIMPTPVDPALLGTANTMSLSGAAGR
jgi:hypothetical protein